MNLLAKVLAGALLFAGVCWSFVAFSDTAPDAPGWSAWLGPLAIAIGLPLLFIFGARHGQQKLDEGEWVEVEGTVDRVVHHGAEFSSHHYMRVRFTSPMHGKFKHDESISTERAYEFANQSKDKSVLADVHSKNRRWINIKSVDGKSWMLLNSERARTASRSTRGTRPSG